ncbi:unnamed protein product [Urochloa humidicola]
MAIPRRACACAFHLLLLVCLLHRTAVQSQPVGEAELLLEIKRAWGDPPKLAAWSAAASVAGAHCRWPYVGCGSAGRVTSLALAGINVTGPVPDAIGGLSSLTHLDASDNLIAGVFPVALYHCHSLQYLSLAWNHIGGELPDDIGRGLRANLSTLDLGVNEFNGTIPVSLSRLRNLRHLALEENRFIGSIPVELGELTSLEILELSINPFYAGQLPASFKNLTNLVSLWVVNCSLVGDFPSYLVKMPKLEVLSLGSNSFTGTIPPEIWSLKTPQWLDVSGNNLIGDVVVDGFAAMSLVTIDVSENKLTGMIPEVFGCLRNLIDLLLLNNNSLARYQ